MYNPAPPFNEPADEHVKIWRYMDFAKFVSLLDKKALYFTRSDRFTDKFEGAIPKLTVKAREAELLDLGSPLAETALREISRSTQSVRKWIFVNCWYMNNYESDAMWQIYGQKNNGIAIRSTFVKLKDSLISPDCVMHIGTVNYIDYDKDILAEGNVFHAIFSKRRSFEYEHELRAVFQKPSLGNDSPAGLYIPCKLDILIDEIFVSPASSDWFKELVGSTLEKYGIDKKVKPSNLDEDPIF